MKSDGIQRAVRANRHDRSEGDAPAIGRVARMPGTGLPKILRRRRNRGERGRHRQGKAVLYWSVLLGVCALGSVAVAMFFWLRPMMDSGAAAEAKIQQNPEAHVRVASQFPSPSEKDALGLAKRAMGIREPGMVAGLFHPGAASPQEIVDFIGGLGALDGAFDHYEWLSSLDANGLSLDGVLLHFMKGGKPRQRIAFLTPDTDGIWKIDFEAFARKTTPSWKELLEKGGDHAVVRVFLGTDSYYNGPFKDDTQWSCYGIGSPDTDQVLLGYSRLESPQTEAIKWMVSKGGGINRATLEIRRVDGAAPNQFEIVRVLAQDWVMSPKPFDEGFK